MLRRLLLSLWFGLLLVPTFGSAEERIREVRVVNLPAVQAIRGTVAVEGLPASSSFFSRESKIVPPVGRLEVTHLVDLGILEVDGFHRMTVSLHVESQGRVTKTGSVGVLLLPEREPIRRSMRMENQILLASEVVADLPVGSTPVAAQGSFDVAFPRYRMLLYNESNASASVDLYTYSTR